ncbi:hypothetical protein [Streptomyces specialis]|uniref:hypothetical protein n=1 Tax=Streptomyces specialis TaxID=498367 RepID=UPI00073EEC74|nr:hypothetical protein [Streptomyces specialis]
MLASLLAACGSTDTSGDSAHETGPEPAQQNTGNETPSQPAEDQTLTYMLGETSDPVAYKVDEAQAMVELTVERVEVGQHDQLEGFFDPEDIADLRPASVHVRVRHLSGDPLPYSYIGATLTVFTADGEPATPVLSVTALDLEGGCPEDGADPLAELPVGAEITQCTTLLISDVSQPSEVDLYLGPGNTWVPNDDNLHWTLDSQTSTA